MTFVAEGAVGAININQLVKRVMEYQSKTKAIETYSKHIQNMQNPSGPRAHLVKPLEFSWPKQALVSSPHVQTWQAASQDLMIGPNASYIILYHLTAPKIAKEIQRRSKGDPKEIQRRSKGDPKEISRASVAPFQFSQLAICLARQVPRILLLKGECSLAAVQRNQRSQFVTENKAKSKDNEACVPLKF
jgi:hypothetical protein